jgi:diguanylate cyclase (GGDEF)-like protein
MSKLENSCDFLTNLLSNRALSDYLKRNAKVVYYLINIDSFTNINNAYGYEVGDMVLKKVSSFLNMLKPNNSNLYRYCSDKFVIVDDRNLEIDAIEKIADAILSFFSHSEIEVDEDISVKISISIGISRSSGLINITQAEMAIRELRTIRRNSYKIFDPQSTFVHNEQQNIYWIQMVKEAVAEENIVVYYQPILNNKTKEIEKFECLARIKDDDEIISPFMFLDAAKASGNLSYVTRSIITQSFKNFSGTQYEFSINISGEDLQLEYLEYFFDKLIKKYDIDPSKVVIEVLEDIVSLDNNAIYRQLIILREMGFKIAIDDFGAESSNLSRLLEIEPDYLKIDGSFIKNILEDTKSQVIVEAIVMICKQSNIKIIAEFIHSEGVQAKIEELGIEYSQGYYIGEPIPNIDSYN